MIICEVKECPYQWGDQCHKMTVRVNAAGGCDYMTRVESMQLVVRQGRINKPKIDREKLAVESFKVGFPQNQ